MILLITHIDLDGIACAVLGKIAFGNNVKVVYANYNNINIIVNELIDSGEHKEYSQIYITDISVDKETAEKINKTVDVEIVYLLDHHETATHLNDYSWAFVKTELLGKKTCGAEMLYTSLITHGSTLNPTKVLNDFVETVRSYDTWDWKRDENQKAKDLNDVLTLIGRDKFVDTYSTLLELDSENETFEIMQFHIEMLKYKRIEIDRYISSKLLQVKTFPDRENNIVAFVLADSNISELGSKICEATACDYCCILYGNKMSLRSVGDFDVSEIARRNNGGGHKNASGMDIDKYYIRKYFEL